MTDQYQALVLECKQIAKQTGRLLLQFWNKQKKLTIANKPDGTPLSAADLAAHNYLAENLQRLTPGVPILSEEGDIPDYQNRENWNEYWLIDPLDGTRGFLEHLSEFSINIALIHDHRPVLGIIHIPAFETIFYAWHGGGAYKEVIDQKPLKIQHSINEALTEWKVLIGKYSKGKRIYELMNDQCRYQISKVNSSIKFCWLAEGTADLYPRLSPIYEWDTAAGQCILEESGGAVVDLQGKALQYNRKASLQTTAFIALADGKFCNFWLNILNR